MTEWAAHVLVDSAVLWVIHIILLRQHVHGETIGRHKLILLGCKRQNKDASLRSVSHAWKKVQIATK